MSQAGFTPILIYGSTTPGNAPSAGNLATGSNGVELAVNAADGKLFYKDTGGVVRVLATTAGSAGDVVGPGSSTDNALVRFDTTTGKLVQNSVGVLSDAGVLTGLTGLTSSGNVTLSALTSGRVTYATTAGLLTDSANLTFNGTTLTANTLNLTTALGVAHGGTGATSAAGALTNLGAYPASNPNGYASGTVTSVASGTGLTGGPITSTGTLSLATSGVSANTYGSSTAIPVITVDVYGRATTITTAVVAGGQYFGTAAVKAIAYNANSISENLTVTAGNNGLSAGPITINTGFTVTVDTGAAWVII